MSEQIMDAYWQTPPMARTAASITFPLSVAIHLHFVSGYWFIWSPAYLWKIPPQLWRPVTSFLITNPDLGILFDTYFLYHYLSQLEVGNARFPRKADLLWYLMFVSGTILMLNYLAGLAYVTFLPALILAMAYTVTQDQRGQKANFYIITIPAQLTPYCMIAVNLLFPGGYYFMLLQLEGLLAAHLFDFLIRLWPEFGGGPNLLGTPNWVVGLIRTPRVLERGFGTAIRPTEPLSGSSTGASRGPLPDSWRTRGSGQRLG
ncbi:hypothetical protein G7046_g2842 [Stylonectria norvegica]|nr:hypothetical protein G7046_g2842 [Stylonectria norvegica]